MNHYLKLRRREQIFVDAYVETGSKTKAAERILPNSKFPRNVAARMMAKPGVAEAIDERKAEAIEEAGINQVRILQELAHVAFFDHRKLYDSSGKLLAVHEWPAELAAGIAAIEHEELYAGRGEERTQIGTLSKYRAWPKVDALKLLMQFKRMLVEQHELTGKNGGPIKAATAVTTSDPIEAARAYEELMRGGG